MKRLLRGGLFLFLFVKLLHRRFFRLFGGLLGRLDSEGVNRLAQPREREESISKREILREREREREKEKTSSGNIVL